MKKYYYSLIYFLLIYFMASTAIFAKDKDINIKDNKNSFVLDVKKDDKSSMVKKPLVRVQIQQPQNNQIISTGTTFGMRIILNYPSSLEAGSSFIYLEGYGKKIKLEPIWQKVALTNTLTCQIQMPQAREFVHISQDSDLIHGMKLLTELKFINEKETVTNEVPIVLRRPIIKFIGIGDKERINRPFELQFAAYNIDKNTVNLIIHNSNGDAVINKSGQNALSGFANQYFWRIDTGDLEPGLYTAIIRAQNIQGDLEDRISFDIAIPALFNLINPREGIYRLGQRLPIEIICDSNVAPEQVQISIVYVGPQGNEAYTYLEANLQRQDKKIVGSVNLPLRLEFDIAGYKKFRASVNDPGLVSEVPIKIK
ncbi:MAG: hypothetical protein AB1755_03450 [Candidatus Omnitrophota bacterium]